MNSLRNFVTYFSDWPTAIHEVESFFHLRMLLLLLFPPTICPTEWNQWFGALQFVERVWILFVILNEFKNHIAANGQIGLNNWIPIFLLLWYKHVCGLPMRWMQAWSSSLITPGLNSDNSCFSLSNSSLCSIHKIVIMGINEGYPSFHCERNIILKNTTFTAFLYLTRYHFA